MEFVIRIEVPERHPEIGASDRRLVERIAELEAALKSAQHERESASRTLGAFWSPGGSMAAGIEAMRKEILGRLEHAFKAGFRWRSSLINAGLDVTVNEIEDRAKAFAEGRWTP